MPRLVGVICFTREFVPDWDQEDPYDVTQT
jgi:hypothetical protein